MSDMINHPPHYQSDTGLEVIDVIEAFFPQDSHLSHVFKYMARTGKKDTPESNIRKSIWWLVRKLSLITGRRFLPLMEYTPPEEQTRFKDTNSGEGVVDMYAGEVRIRLYKNGEERTTVIMPAGCASDVALKILSCLEDRK